MVKPAEKKDEIINYLKLNKGFFSVESISKRLNTSISYTWKILNNGKNNIKKLDGCYGFVEAESPSKTINGISNQSLTQDLYNILKKCNEFVSINELADNLKMTAYDLCREIGIKRVKCSNNLKKDYVNFSPYSYFNISKNEYELFNYLDEEFESPNDESINCYITLPMNSDLGIANGTRALKSNKNLLHIYTPVIKIPKRLIKRIFIASPERLEDKLSSLKIKLYGEMISYNRSAYKRKYK